MDTRGSLTIDPAGRLARLAAWQGSGRRRPVAALAMPGAEPAFFAADEVLLAHDARDAIEAFTRLGAEVVPEPPLPAAPLEARRRRPLPDRLPPAPVRMRFSRPMHGEALDEGVRLLQERTGRAGRALEVTSPEAAALAGHVFRHAAGGAEVMLNWFGQGDALPLRTLADEALPAQGIAGTLTNPGPGDNALGWAAYRGPARVVQAWQLIESHDLLRAVDRGVLIAVMDGGFWLDGNGVPLSNPNTDFGTNILQADLIAGTASAGGANPSTCGGGACPWHGNAVASIAASTVHNDFGAAGVGGTVAWPVLLRTDLSTDEILRGVRLCVAWGVDVLNMSFGVGPDDNVYRLPEFGPFFFTNWNQTFQFAADNGLVMVASAGNAGVSVPDQDSRRPRTNTPGVLAVGALGADGVTAAAFSNFGPGVALWAPGTNLPVGPDGNNAAWSLFSGTSAAAPFVAGIAAMIRAVAPQTTSARVREILLDTAWGGAGNVTLGVDAYAAVLLAMGGRLPNDALERPGGPGLVTPLVEAPGQGGRLLVPMTPNLAISAAGDRDAYRFTLAAPARIDLRAEWYRRLARLDVELEAEDPANPDPADLVETRGDGTLSLTGELSAGAYRVFVGASGPTAYELRLRRLPFSIASDPDEPNNSFEQATCIEFRPRNSLLPEFLRRRCLRPGLHRATLHRTFFQLGPNGPLAVDTDFYVFTGPTGLALTVPVIEILDADEPVDVTLYDEARQVVREWKGISRGQTARVVPVKGKQGWLSVRGGRPTGYRVSVRLELDRAALPSPGRPPFVVPEWWWRPDPLDIRRGLEVFAVEIEDDLTRRDGLEFEALGAGPVELRLLDLQERPVGVVARAEGARPVERLRLATAELPRGTYLLEVRRERPEARLGRIPALRPVPPADGWAVSSTGTEAPAAAEVPA